MSNVSTLRTRLYLDAIAVVCGCWFLFGSACAERRATITQSEPSQQEPVAAGAGNEPAQHNDRMTMTGTAASTEGASGSASTDPEALLVASAKDLWNARQARDWEKVFDFFVPEKRKDWTPEDFVKWSEDYEPFLVEGFEIQSWEIEYPRAWLYVKYETRIREFASLPPREADIREMWLAVDGAWYPAPREQRDFFPAPPSARTVSSEPDLKARWKESWRARSESDWESLLNLVHPRDRARMDLPSFSEAQAMFEYADCELLWVEAVRSKARVCAIYSVRPNDPNLTKLAPKQVAEIEHWELHDNQWYIVKK